MSSGGGPNFPQRKWTGNDDRGDRPEMRESYRECVFLLELGTWIFGSANSLEVTPQGGDKQTLPESPTLGTRQEGTSTAQRQPVLWLVDSQSIQNS